MYVKGLQSSGPSNFENDPIVWDSNPGMRVLQHFDLQNPRACCRVLQSADSMGAA